MNERCRVLQSFKLLEQRSICLKSAPQILQRIWTGFDTTLLFALCIAKTTDMYPSYNGHTVAQGKMNHVQIFGPIEHGSLFLGIFSAIILDLNFLQIPIFLHQPKYKSTYLKDALCINSTQDFSSSRYFLFFD